MATDNEAELIAKAAEGDAKAFARLLADHEARLFRMVYRFVGNTEDARDVLQEIALSAYRSLPGFRGQSSFYTWIYRIAVRTCCREFRRSRFKLKRRTDSLDAPESHDLIDRARREFTSRHESPRSVLEREENIYRIRMAIRALPDKLFEVVVLRDIEDLSYEEIASALAVSKGTVMSRLHRGRKRLLRQLKQSERK